MLLKNYVSQQQENSLEFFGCLVRESQINCAVLSRVRPDFHATSATPLVPTVRNVAQIANKFAALFAISEGRRNTLVEFLSWRFKTQSFSRSFIKLTCHFVQVRLRVYR